MAAVDFTKDTKEALYLFIILFFHFNVTAPNKEDIFGGVCQCWFICLPLKKLQIDSAGIFLEGLVVAQGTTHWILVMTQIMKLECQRWKNKMAKRWVFFSKEIAQIKSFPNSCISRLCMRRHWGIYGFL